MSFSFLNMLNQEQQKAVQYINGPSLILAGAGSGKTRVLTYKAMYLLLNKQARSENILMLTFTNKAADEMRERIRTQINKDFAPEKITATTFHSFAAGVLRRHGTASTASRDFVIFDEADQKDIMKDILKQKLIATRLSAAYLLYKISQAKEQLLTPADLAELNDDIFNQTIAEVYKYYQQRLQQLNALDFDDLLFETAKLFQQQPQILTFYQKRFCYILVDEYQDTNHAQYQIAKQLASRHKNITVVGDFSQSIYSWRGADFRNLEKFQIDFKENKVFNLERNYRSHQHILDLAHTIISQNTTHPILKLWTDNKNGDEPEILFLQDDEDEANFVINKIFELVKNERYLLKDIAVLYRTNAQSRIIEETCLSIGLPYRIYGGIRFYERKEVKDIIAFLRLINNSKDKLALKRLKKLGKYRAEKILEVLSKQKSDDEPGKTIQNILNDSPYLDLYNQEDPEDSARLENIRELVSVAYNFKSITEFLDTVSLIEAGYEFKNDTTDRLNLLTLHAAKGLEFRAVFIIGVEQGILPHNRSSGELNELEEERRLFYVGITRAKEKLFITYSEKRRVYGRIQYSLPSQFLTETGLVDF